MRARNPYTPKQKNKPRQGQRFATEAAKVRDEVIAKASRAAAPDLVIAEVAGVAVELRRRGASYTQITKAVNASFPPAPGIDKWTRKQIVDLVAGYVAAIDIDAREPTKIIKRMHVDRLDAIMFGTDGTDGLFEKARAGNLQAIDRFLALQERQLALAGIPINKLVIEAGNQAAATSDPIAAVAAEIRRRLEARRAAGVIDVVDVNAPPAKVNGDAGHVNGGAHPVNVGPWSTGG